MTGDPIVHLELHTRNVVRACDFYRAVFAWRAERIHVGTRSYLALGWGDAIEVGVVEGASEPVWLPYVEVADIDDAVRRARVVGAEITLPATEGPAGWRGVVATADTAAIGLWQPKRRPRPNYRSR
jgi:predicted enzyme related to lactoylglutathione lyase